MEKESNLTNNLYKNDREFRRKNILTMTIKKFDAKKNNQSLTNIIKSLTWKKETSLTRKIKQFL